MQKKFEINRTKIKGGCQSGRKMVTHNSKSDLPCPKNAHHVRGQIVLQSIKINTGILNRFHRSRHQLIFIFICFFFRCPVDWEIMGEFEYSSSKTTALVHFQAHKFPYTSSVYYQCNVRLCIRHAGGCEDTVSIYIFFQKRFSL